MSTSLPLIVSLVSLAGVLVGASLQHFLGRALEHRKQVYQQKGQAYADYFKAAAEIAAVGRQGGLANLTDAKIRVCLYGSRQVVRDLAAFERHGASLTTPEARQLALKLLSAMRSDVGAMGGEAAAEIGLIIYGRDWES